MLVQIVSTKMLKIWGFLILFVFCLHQSLSIKRRCLQPLEEGSGKAFMRNWFYNSTSQRCQRFIFFGGLKNGNNFDTQARCRKICLTQVPAAISLATRVDGA
ncbi:kappaPI-actitoxin-Avd3c [Drosophila ficusphila]|uniref:kappaPI-actitoxin-Avd3c n=1 Tax=Drosophila ficusphila TaxID=30025 RepID=UPI0007E69A61|nr:kappaPI-actitoxin-Avd3c [Drosophila ficusphila]